MRKTLLIILSILLIQGCQSTKDSIREALDLPTKKDADAKLKAKVMSSFNSSTEDDHLILESKYAGKITLAMKCRYDRSPYFALRYYAPKTYSSTGIFTVKSARLSIDSEVHEKKRDFNLGFSDKLPSDVGFDIRLLLDNYYETGGRYNSKRTNFSNSFDITQLINKNSEWIAEQERGCIEKVEKEARKAIYNYMAENSVEDFLWDRFQVRMLNNNALESSDNAIDMYAFYGNIRNNHNPYINKAMHLKSGVFTVAHSDSEGTTFSAEHYSLSFLPDVYVKGLSGKIVGSSLSKSTGIFVYKGTRNNFINEQQLVFQFIDLSPYMGEIAENLRTEITQYTSEVDSRGSMAALRNMYPDFYEHAIGLRHFASQPSEAG